MVMVFTDIWICDIVYVYCIFLPVLGKCNNLIVTFCIIYFIMLYDMWAIKLAKLL
ncbi:unnamed protein product, partial [Urochloa humidicola]